MKKVIIGLQTINGKMKTTQNTFSSASDIVKSHIYVVIQWRYFGWTICGNEYSFYKTICAFPDRKMATAFIKDIGAKYENGHYLKGEYLYTIKQLDFYNKTTSE